MRKDKITENYGIFGDLDRAVGVNTGLNGVFPRSFTTVFIDLAHQCTQKEALGPANH